MYVAILSSPPVFSQLVIMISQYLILIPFEKNDLGTKSEKILISFSYSFVFHLSPYSQKRMGPLSISFNTLSPDHRMVFNTE